MKVCTGCNEEKDLECFSLHSGFKDGRNSRCKICKCAKQREGYHSGKYKKTPYTYEKQIRQKYGITKEQYQELFDRCSGMCEICGSVDKLNVDHCHITGVVRGLLCTRCNTGLGKFGDDISRLQQAIAYLEYSGLAERTKAGVC